MSNKGLSLYFLYPHDSHKKCNEVYLKMLLESICINVDGDLCDG